jgi:hypothetical protein
VKIKSEKGMALPLVMIAIMIGVMVIPPFLGHTGTSLIGSRTYAQSIGAQYACDSGVEHAIWNLTDGGITANLTYAGDTVSYSLPESINGLATSVKISNCWETIAWDNFESGGWAGGSGWLGGWTHTGTSSITTSGAPYEGTYHMLLQSSDGYVKRSVDLSKQVSARLRLRAKVNSFEAGETTDCLVSSDGTTWTTAYTWTFDDSDNTYHYYDIDLTSYSFTSTFWIAFDANMSGTGDYFYVDDLDIVWVVGSYKNIASENFESGGWGGGSGWSGNWTHTGYATVTNTGIPYQGTYHLMLQNGSGDARRSLDLSEQGVVHLQFWAKADSFEGSENARARISSNGVSWTTVEEWVNGDDDSQYHFYDIDLSSYTLTDNFWIRFVANMGQTNDYFYVDNIDIESLHGYAITVAAGDRVIKAAVNTDDGIVTVISWYFI